MSDHPPPELETAPDPDSDDLDDLDDVLDEFNKTTINPPQTSSTTTTAPSASGPGRPVEAGEDEDFAKQLQAGMASLIGELDNNPEMQKQFEGLMKELSGSAGGEMPDLSSPNAAPFTLPSPSQARQPSAASSTSKSKASSAEKARAETDFQSTIAATMARMQASGDSANAAATSSSEDDLLAQMLKGLQDGGGMDGAGGDEDFNAMLMGMMSQLTNKEVLYEPMKELHDKFPAWMTEHAAGVPKPDMERYVEQQRLVGEIVGRFERKGYSDGNESDRDYIVERMQNMQAAGSPPPDLVGDMSAAQEALGDLDSGCPQQ